MQSNFVLEPTLPSISAPISRSISDLGKVSSKMLPVEEECTVRAWCMGDGVPEPAGLASRDGEISTSGTLRKCSDGIRICKVQHKIH